MVARLSFGLGLAVLAAACTPAAMKPLPPQAAAPMDDYRIGRGDTIAVKFFYTPELNEDLVVRPDGNVSMQLVGDVPVAGRKPSDVAAELRQRYQQYIQTRDVAVIVRDSKSARAFVGGEVKNPVMLPIDGEMSVVDAIFMAGGTLDDAELSSVVLLRTDGKTKEAHLVDVKASLAGGDPPPTLRPYDVVYVPKSVIGEVGTYVDLYINHIIPRQASFTAFYTVNPTAVAVPPITQ
jgi:protein involved in polysaccharide export with SLBB domain